MARQRTRKPTRVDPLDFSFAATTPAAFISQHSAFTLDELRAAYKRMGRDPKAARDLVAYHLAQRKLLPVRRGVYAAPRGVDPFALANCMAPDAVVAYDGALLFHRRDTFNHSIHYVTAGRPPVLDWNEVVYTPVHSPDRLGAGGLQKDATSSGHPLRVYGFEETLVDCLERLDLAPQLEELWNVFLESPYIDVARATRHWERLGRSPLVASRFGLFALANKRVDERDLGTLQRGCLKAPAYFQRVERKKHHQQIISKWNLIVPEELYELWMRSMR